MNESIQLGNIHSGSIHAGHRQRLRERYAQEGTANFSPHETLELLLSFVIPRRDTNAIAHNLINTLGSLSNVLDAPIGSLKKIYGIGEQTAVFLDFLKGVLQQYQVSKFGPKPVLDTTELQAAFCQALHTSSSKETFYLICMNVRCKVVAVYKLEEGAANNVTFYITKIIEKIMAVHSARVLITHNHPGGQAIPSDADVRATFEIVRTMRAIDMAFEDHIIVGDDNEWCSLRQTGVI